MRLLFYWVKRDAILHYPVVVRYGALSRSNIVPIIFDWREVMDRPWRERFTGAELIGGSLWVEQPRDTGERWESELQRFVGQLRNEGRQTKRTLRPRTCVFLSHRHTDVALAEGLAHEIDRQCNGDVDIWLDVWDPDLATLEALYGAGQVTAATKAIETAMVIEMGLVNSTHVLAIITDNAHGSRWIPYEYGRVKEGFPFAEEAGCWLAKGVSEHDLAEYMHLGPKLYSEIELGPWLCP